MRIRIRSPEGQATLVLPETATVGDLRASIAEKTSLSHYDIKHGYPPKPLFLDSQESNVKIADLGVKLDGEQLIVSRSSNAPASEGIPRQKEAVPASATPSLDQSTPSAPQNRTQASKEPNFSFADVGTTPPSSNPKSAPSKPAEPLSLTRKQNMSSEDAPEVPLPTHASTMVLRIMPDDNSCLFRAFNTAFFGTSMDNMVELRSVIAQYIQSHPEIYSEAVLDRKVDDYCRWIQTEDAWGGSIELDILSKHFNVEICSIDVQTLRTDRYNEGRPQRCILVYSGIHYDTIALSPSDPPYKQAYAPPDFDTKVFDAFDEVIMQTAVELCRILQSQHYFTDTAGFDIRCNVCGFMTKGEQGATKHAMETGHMDFGEAG